MKVGSIVTPSAMYSMSYKKHYTWMKRTREPHLRYPSTGRVALGQYFKLHRDGPQVGCFDGFLLTVLEEQFVDGDDPGCVDG